jgi:hypothetical protein
MSTRQGRLIVPKGSTKARGMVHKLVADTAKGMAEAVYEALCSKSNAFYVLWPSAPDFVMRRWHSFIQPAREQLSEMLGMPDSQVNPDQKAEIYEALLKHNAVNPAANHVDEIIANPKRFTQ